MPQELDHAAMREMKEVILPAAKPMQEIPERVTTEGASVPGKIIQGRAVAGTLPHRDIPHQDFPRAVYLHPRKPFKRMFLPVDGHGNKEWLWVANEAKTLVVKSEEELAAAKKQGFQLKHYVAPAMPLGSADPEAEEEAVEVAK